MQKNYVLVNSKLYAELFELGGDSLVAVYSMLKKAKSGAIKIEKEENINIYHTLKRKTGLSVTTLRKYIKILIRENICFFDGSGNFVLIGSNKLNTIDKYKSRKLVRIVTTSFKETKLNSFFLRVLTMERIQKRAIDRKDKQTDIITRQSKGYYITREEKDFLKLCDKYYENSNEYNAKTVLSNQGFSNLKHNSAKSKSSGLYWKFKLISAKKIQTTRRMKFIKECTREQFLYYKVDDKALVYMDEMLFKELAPAFTTDMQTKQPRFELINKPCKVEIKTVIPRLNHLSYDWIHEGSKK